MQKKMSPVQILSGKELEKLNVYSVADALRYFSGVQIKDYGGIGGLKPSIYEVWAVIMSEYFTMVLN